MERPIPRAEKLARPTPKTRKNTQKPALASTGRPQKAAETIAGIIRNSIAKGELAPGAMLPSESTMIDIYRVSRPSIREAVRILESENIVTVSRGARGGAIINEPTPEQVARTVQFELQRLGATFGDVYEVRMNLEPVAARLVAERCPADAAKELEAIVKNEVEGIATPDLRIKAAAEFHKTLLQLSGNVAMALIASALNRVVERHLSAIFSSDPNGDSDAIQQRALIGIKSHRRLIEYIRKGDGYGAEHHWRTHMEIVGELLYNKFSNQHLSDIID